MGSGRSKVWAGDVGVGVEERDEGFGATGGFGFAGMLLLLRRSGACGGGFEASSGCLESVLALLGGEVEDLWTGEGLGGGDIATGLPLASVGLFAGLDCG